uniref:CHK kinase-like domain-containing protein n=1 Tax=Homalodisca liturata TaxID=320908 RepID=A0A1B6ITS2_9HEMI
MEESWLNSSFLAKVLRSVEGTQEEVEVIKVQSSSVVPSGANYCSLLSRVHVNYKLGQENVVKSTSLIVKTPLISGEMKNFLERAGVYRTECVVYNEILPKMYELKDLKSTAKSFHCPLEKSLVLEDLKLSGFVMADRLKQLDFHHCQLVLERMAMFHALSVGVHHKYPDLLPNTGVHLLYNDTLPEPDKKQLRGLSQTNLTSLIEELEGIDGCKKYADAIREIAPSHYDKALEFLVPGDKGLNVYNFGDVWINNMMFKYNDDGEVVDVKFIDFQNAQFGTYAVDLNYFWWSSANESVRENHREELFEVYRRTLNRTLDEIGCSEHLTKEDFDREMKSSGPYVVYVLSGVLPLAMAQPDDHVDYNAVKPDDYVDAPNRKNLQSKYFKKVIVKMLQQIDKNGLLDSSI